MENKSPKKKKTRYYKQEKNTLNSIIYFNTIEYSESKILDSE